MGNKLQKEKLEREAAAKGLAGGSAPSAPVQSSASKPEAPAADGDYSNYNNKLTINDFVLLKVLKHFQSDHLQFEIVAGAGERKFRESHVSEKER